MSASVSMATPHLPTSPSAIGSSESLPISVGMSNAVDSPSPPERMISLNRQLVSSAVPKPANMRIVHSFERYIEAYGPAGVRVLARELAVVGPVHRLERDARHRRERRVTQLRRPRRRACHSSRGFMGADYLDVKGSAELDHGSGMSPARSPTDSRTRRSNPLITSASVSPSTPSPNWILFSGSVAAAAHARPSGVDARRASADRRPSRAGGAPGPAPPAGRRCS